MTGLALYLRSRRAPGALAGAAAGTAAMWTLARATSQGSPPGVTFAVITVLLAVLVLAATLGGPDDALDRTAARPWAALRAAHLLVVAAVAAAMLLATQLADTGFGPAGLVVRDAVGLVGLTAMCAPVLGAARAWFLPLGWTIAAGIQPVSSSVLTEVLTWQSQSPGSAPAALAAAVLAVGGLTAYALLGPAPRPPAEAAL